MTVRRSVQSFFAVSFLMGISGAVVAQLATVNQHALAESQRVRMESYKLADELRQSSDDLTRFARTYVATGDAKYERYYWDVLAIRNGQKPRPEHYERVYWDFVTGGDGRPPRPDSTAVSLQQLMRNLGFTEAEFAKLREAQINSDALVRTEEIAMHAMKGQYDDGSGAFTRSGRPDQAMAIRLMYSAAYHQEKARIMRPIDEFLAMLDTRTASTLAGFTRRSALFWRLIQGMVVVFVVLLVGAYPLAHGRVLTPVSDLQRQTQMVAADLDRLAVVAGRIARGERAESFTVAATPLCSTRRDEVGELTRLHDTMISRLQETGKAIATITAELRQANEALKEENAERRRAEEDAAAAHRQIREAHAELLAIIDTVPAGLALLDPDGSPRLQNKASERLFGVPPDTPAERKDAWRRFSVRDNSGRPARVADLPHVRALSGTEITGEEYDVQRPDGRTLAILVGAAPLRDDRGQITGAVLGFQDITRLRELDRMKDEFLAIASHELRTPLTAIRGSLQLLLADDAVPDADHRELLEVALRSSERLVRIINDMLDISKMEAGRLELRLVSLEVTALVQQAVEGVQAVADEAGVSVARALADGLPAVRGDADRLTQAIVNLLSNAIKFSPRGSSVTVAARDTEDGVAISVADRGRGIAPGDIPKLFRKFQQLDNADTRRAGGTGLGLSITKAIVEEHGGTITVDSVVGRGTTFTFTVPRAAVAPRHPAPTVPAAARGETTTDVRTVLVVEEDPRTREAAVRAMQAAGFETREASTGADAIRLAQQHRPDAIAIAFTMRDADGRSAVETLSQNRETRGIPLVITWAAPPEGGDRETLGEPMDLSELAERVEHVLHGRTHATVLVADDDAELRFVIRTTLERHGFRVIEAADGREALSAAAAETVDLVLLDLKMPHVHGNDVIRGLRKRDATAHIPIVVLSGSAGARQSLESLVLGANVFFTKPADLNALVREVARLLRAGRTA